MARSAKTLLFAFLLSSLVAGAANAAEKSYSSWGEIAEDMVKFLDEAGKKYSAGDSDGAKKSVNDAYFGLYEKMGFERTVMSYISGKRVSLVEYKFSFVKKEMTKGAPVDEVHKELAELCRLLREDADQLDGKSEDAPKENEEFIIPTDEELREFEEAVSPEGLTPEEFEKQKIEFLQKRRAQKEKK